MLLKSWTEREIWDQDMAWLAQSKAVVAECTVPSLGVGYELGIAEKLGLPCLVLFRGREEDRKLSAMLGGNPKMRVVYYSQISEACEAVDAFLRNTIQ